MHSRSHAEDPYLRSLGTREICEEAVSMMQCAIEEDIQAMLENRKEVEKEKKERKERKKKEKEQKAKKN